MKKYFVQLSAYNTWANRIIAEFVTQAGEDRCTMVCQSSFPTIRQTLIHVRDAQDVWLKRLNGESVNAWPASDNVPASVEIASQLVSGSLWLENYINDLPETDFDREILYRNLKGEEFTGQIAGILGHVFNHGTFHRGQIVTMLRTTGFTSLRSTDLITFLRT